MKEVAMQSRCIYCKREQYAMAVYAISHGECGCAWCGKVPPVMSYKEWHKAMKEGYNERMDSKDEDQGSDV